MKVRPPTSAGGPVSQCGEIRDDLPEHALGTLAAERRRVVDRHLAWCAGCRKEAAELAEGAAAAGLSLAPPEAPPPGLDDRLVRAVRRGARGSRSRVAAAAAAAALLVAAISGGWAVAMRQRVQQLADAAASAQGRAERFEEAVEQLVAPRGGGRILSAPLSTGREGPPAGGRAVFFDSRMEEDWALVIVGGLPSDGEPYRGYAVVGGQRISLGRLWPSAPGEMTTYRIFDDHDLSSAVRVVIVDANGRPVLQGKLSAGS